MSEAEDTIVAVSTPTGYSMRAVVRLSGPEALQCAAGRFRPGRGRGDGWQGTFRATAGELALAGEGLSVPAVVYVMRAPRSYTREDVVEFHVPGSPALLDMLLDDLLATGPAGLRLAEPGEFTRRAFLNGRIDLAAAESVLAVVRARNESELLAASSKLTGAVGRRCALLQEQITGLRVRVEAALDFAEHGIELVEEQQFAEQCRRVRQAMEREIERGRDDVASDGSVHVVLCGPPNAGKSSLLNRLVRCDRALVHPQAGTTRDSVSAEIDVGGVSFHVSDTAGLAATPHGPEAEAVERAARQISTCQLLVLVLDGSVPLPDDPLAGVALPPPSRVVCVVNKCDLPRVLDEAALRPEAFAWETLRTSALTGEGVDALRQALGRTVTEGRLDASASDCLFNARQRHAVRRAVEELAEAQRAAEAGMGYEFAALNLREAADALGEVTGGIASQDILDRIFSQFCIGK